MSICKFLRILLLLIAAFLHLIPSDCNNIEKSSKITRLKRAQAPKLNCNRFKCPKVEDMVCVKMRRKKLGSKTKEMFMVLINKCELEYLKCRQEYQATELPMKNCGYKVENGNSGKRWKRRVGQGYRKPIKRDSSGSFENSILVGAAKESLPFVTNHNENNGPDKTASKGAPQSDDGTEEDDSDKARIYEIGNIGKETEAKPNGPEKLVEPQQQGDDADQNSQKDDENDQIEDINDDNVDVTPDTNDVNNDDNNDQDAEMETIDAQVTDNPVNDKDDSNKKKDIGVPDNYDLTAANEGVDFEEYAKDCPSKCPARDVMICARCQDGIYRTFMSSCHLRMFNCDHPDEKTELVSRLPCVLSAPYLAEVASPQGRLAEPGDVDEVLKFIRCREKKELGRDDPKCNVYNDDKNKKQLRRN